jgi:hypothetical protein
VDIFCSVGMFSVVQVAMQRPADVAKGFLVFLRHISGKYLKLGHNTFFYKSFPFIVHALPYNSYLYNLGNWKFLCMNQE